MQNAPDHSCDPTVSVALDALGNQIRREIIAMLANGPLAAGQIAAHFPISRPAVSKHLRLLQDAQMITHDTIGNRNIYRLRQAGFDRARLWLDHFWIDALNRFSLVAENTVTAAHHE